MELPTRKLDPDAGAGGVRRADVQVTAERLDAVGQSTETGTLSRIGSTDAVVADDKNDTRVVPRDLDGGGASLRVLLDVRQSLTDHVVHGDLQGLRQPSAQLHVQAHR